MIDRKKHIEEILKGGQMFMRKSKVASPVGEKSLTPAQWGVAMYIAPHEGLTTNELAAAFNISGSAATQLINALVEKGFVIRKDHPTDRRSHKLTLSTSSRKQIEDHQKKLTAEMLKLYAVLTDKEFETFAALNTKLLDALKKS